MDEKLIVPYNAACRWKAYAKKQHPNLLHSCYHMERQNDVLTLLMDRFVGMNNSEDLAATIKAANTGGYEIGIPIHCDYSDNADAHGAHVCFYPGSTEGGRLASCIAGTLADLLPGRANTIQARPNLAVLKQTHPVWVLCECGFISNPGDADMMKHRPESIANAVAQGVDAYSLNQ